MVKSKTGIVLSLSVLFLMFFVGMVSAEVFNITSPLNNSNWTQSLGADSYINFTVNATLDGYCWAVIQQGENEANTSNEPVALAQNGFIYLSNGISWVGDINMTVYCNDTGENIYSTEMISFHYDSTTPTISVNMTPIIEVGGNFSAPFYINFTLSGDPNTPDTNQESCWYKYTIGGGDEIFGDVVACPFYNESYPLDLDLAAEAVANNTYAFLINSSSNGVLNITLYINDSFGNIGTQMGDLSALNYDSTGPRVNITEPVENQVYNASEDLFINVSIGDFGLAELDDNSCNYSVEDENGNFISFLASVSCTIMNALGINISGSDFNDLNDGFITLTIVATDNFGNIGDEQAIFILDRIELNVVSAPSVGPSTTSAVIRWSANEGANSSVNFSLESDLSNSEFENNLSFINGSRTVTLSGLTTSTRYYYNITTCDRSGNCIVNGTYSFTTDDLPADSGGSSGGGGGGGETGLWLSTYPVLSSVQFSAGYTRELTNRSRIGFKLGNETHHAGIIEITNTSATINVSSTPQIKTLSVGEEWKLDVDANGIYDLLVKLINITNAKANVSIKSINETVVIAVDSTGSTVADNSSIALFVDSDDASGILGGVTEGNETILRVIIYIVLIVVLLVLVWFFYLRKYLREKKVEKAVRYTNKK